MPISNSQEAWDNYVATRGRRDSDKRLTIVAAAKAVEAAPTVSAPLRPPIEHLLVEAGLTPKQAAEVVALLVACTS